ncbi:MAG: hypothetical protein NTW21_18040 [Verrucomicrobia bacterium]|nr:hypothetical protein [Verrucomicrobiota bacterium]
MSTPSAHPPTSPPVSPARQRFLQRLAALAIKPTSHEYDVRWAEAWITAHGHRSAGTTTASCDALGRVGRVGRFGRVGRDPRRFTRRYRWQIRDRQARTRVSTGT